MYIPETKTLYNRLKSSAKKRNIPFNLTHNDINQIGWPLTCPILGIPLKFNRGTPQDNSYSIDRIDNTKGYDPDNIVVVSYKANKLKSTATKQELKQISEFYQSVDTNL